MSLAAHVAIVAGLFLWVQGEEPRIFDPVAVTVSLVHLPPPEPPAPPASAPKPPKAPKAAPKPAKRATIKPVKRTPTKPPPRQLARNVKNPRPHPEPLRAGDMHSDEASNELSEAQLVGAASAGEGGGSGGGGGGSCNMLRRIEEALRKDPLVRSAVAGSSGKAIMVWNGGWVQSHGEDGKGLAAVREAIIWEIGFAPAACKSQPMHGLVLISLNEPRPTRLAVGVGDWRWSDLLTLR